MACRKARGTMLTQGYRGRRYRIYFSGDGDSADTEVRSDVECCSRNGSCNHYSRNTRNSNQLSVLASTIQGALNRYPPMPEQLQRTAINRTEPDARPPTPYDLADTQMRYASHYPMRWIRHTINHHAGIPTNRLQFANPHSKKIRLKNRLG